jgi:hypothetical protein
MRTVYLLPLAALAVVAGCGSEEREQTARSVPQRDLTLVTQTAEVKIASRLETQQLRIHRTVHPSQPAARPTPAARARPVAPKVVLAAVSAPAAAEPIAQPATEASIPNDRELLPGKTVTLIPASSGPSVGPDGTDDIPAAEGGGMVARGGGTCPGRGRRPGIGIATAPRPDFR